MKARTQPETLALRVPPHSIEAEQSVLGALLLDNLAWDRAADLLADGDFYRYEHRLIFGVIGALVTASRPADVITVFERLQANGKAEDAGGLVYLNALAQSVPSAANVGRYAEIVRDRAMRRRLIAAVDEASGIAWQDAGPCADALDSIASLFAAQERAQDRRAPQLLRNLVVRAIDRYQTIDDGTAPPAIETGVGPLDRMLGGGMRPGRLYGIAARPSVGKSSAARTIALHAAEAGHTTLLLSQEMPADEVTDAALSELGRLDGMRLQTGMGSSDDDWARVCDAGDRAARMPLYIDDQGSLTLVDIRRKARTVRGVRVVVLDYLQLCASTLKGKSTNDEVAEISKGLKALALELGVSIIVLSQLNRAVELRASKEPVLADLRDSGAIEQDLDVAVLLWTACDDDAGGQRLVGWKLAKNRSGRTGMFAMRWAPATNTWAESDEPLHTLSAGQQRRRGADL